MKITLLYKKNNIFFLELFIQIIKAIKFINLMNIIKNIFLYFSKIARSMIGIPDYNDYINYMILKNPNKPIMNYKEFFRERQIKRYSSKVNKCC